MKIQKKNLPCLVDHDLEFAALFVVSCCEANITRNSPNNNDNYYYWIRCKIFPKKFCIKAGREGHNWLKVEQLTFKQISWQLRGNACLLILSANKISCEKSVSVQNNFKLWIWVKSSHNNYWQWFPSGKKQASPDQKKLTVNRSCKTNCIL